MLRTSWALKTDLNSWNTKLFGKCKKICGHSVPFRPVIFTSMSLDDILNNIRLKGTYIWRKKDEFSKDTTVNKNKDSSKCTVFQHPPSRVGRDNQKCQCSHQAIDLWTQRSKHLSLCMQRASLFHQFPLSQTVSIVNIFGHFSYCRIFSNKFDPSVVFPGNADIYLCIICYVKI